MTKNLTDQLRAQLKELDAKHDAIVARAAPLRAGADKMSNEYRAKRDAVVAQIREAEIGLAEVDRDRALLARALGGKRMSDAIGTR